MVTNTKDNNNSNNQKSDICYITVNCLACGPNNWLDCCNSLL